MRRPDNLPDFSKPPLAEVVLGVQFSPVPGYSSVDARQVWELFKESFPVVEERPLLAPQFETFGGANRLSSLGFHVGPPPVGSRLWFLSQDANHLIQFQSDRFLTNWRKGPNLQPYPRFEVIADSFERNLQILADHFMAAFKYQIDINQAEVSYVNLIQVQEFAEAGKWFNLCDSGFIDIEALNTNFVQVVKDREGKPYARFYNEIQSVFSVEGKRKAFQLSLTFKGKPATSGIPSAVAFVRDGRERIVNRFRDITTAEAQEIWGRLS